MGFAKFFVAGFASLAFMSLFANSASAFSTMDQTPSQSKWDNTLIEALSQKQVTIKSVTENAAGGEIYIVSEDHDQAPHHDNQLKFLQSLGQYNPRTPITVGMEFLDYTQENNIYLYLDGMLPEPAFLKAVGWGGNNFDFYRPLIHFPLEHYSTTHGLNLPQKIASRISKVGVAGLTDDERKFLPKDFSNGNPLYKKRFMDTMGDHPGVPADQMDRYFEAMSAWDDTMAAQAISIVQHRPRTVLVIIVGNFHAEFGGGLPDRLRTRGFTKVATITQIAAEKLTADELDKALKLDPLYGLRSDFIWVTGEPTKAKLEGCQTSSSTYCQSESLRRLKLLADGQPGGF